MVTYHVDYEGSTIVGVFADGERAERFAWERDRHNRENGNQCEWVEVTAYGEPDRTTGEQAEVFSFMSPRMPRATERAAMGADEHKRATAVYMDAVRRFEAGQLFSKIAE